MSGNGYRDSIFYTLVFKNNTREKAIEVINENIKRPSFNGEFECAMRTFYMFYDKMKPEQADEKVAGVSNKKNELDAKAKEISQLQAALVTDSLEDAVREEWPVENDVGKEVIEAVDEKRQKKLDSLAKAREARKAKKATAVGFSDLPNAE